MAIDANTRATIYTLSNGSINLQNASSSNIAGAVGNFAAKGRKDRENNTVYDNYMRYEKMVAVASIGRNYSEAKAISAYNAAGFGSDATKSVMKDLGYGKTDGLEGIRNNHDKIYAMRQLSSKSNKYLSNYMPSTDAHGNAIPQKFTGSRQDVAAIRQEIAKMRASGNHAGADKLEAHLNFNQNTAKYGQDVSEGKRAYGKQVATQYVTGGDIYQGVAFYKTGMKLTTTAAKGATNLAGTLIERQSVKTNALVQRALPNTKVANVSQNLAARAKDANARIHEMNRPKSRAEKRAAHRDRKRENYLIRNRRLGQRQARLAKSMKTAPAGSLASKVMSAQYGLNAALIQRNTFLRQGGLMGRIQANRYVVRFNRVKQRLQRINPVRKLFQLPNALSKLKKKFFRAIGKYIIIVAGPAVIVALVGSVVPVIIGGLFSFFWTEKITKYADEIKSANYIQYIVDTTTTDVAQSLESALVTDAENYYLSSDTKVRVNEYEWWADVDQAYLNHCYSTELGSDGPEVVGISANLQPIIQMMHYRFNDVIDYKNFASARAYTYYMYVYSHDVARDDSGAIIHQYETLENHTKEQLYDYSVFNSTYSFDYNNGNPKVTRPSTEEACLCTNIYIHGYDEAYRDATNDIMSKGRLGMKTCLALLGRELSDEFTGESLKRQGIWLNEKPHDANTVCDNYKVYKGGLKCGKPEHEHGPGCYDDEGKLVCGMENHKHQAWHGENDPGCYDTYYVCLGHCGGHISPYVDLYQDMSYQNLACHDNLVVTDWLYNEDISLSSFAVVHGDTMTDFDEWKASWGAMMGTWKFAWLKSFSPLGWFQAAIHWGQELFVDAVSTIPDPQPRDDKFKFQGWFKSDGTTLNEKYMKELEDIYGTWDDPDEPFQEANEFWEEVPVVFPAGSAPRLTKKDVQFIMKQILAANPGLSQERIDVLEEALNEVGCWTYLCTGAAHQNGYRLKGGQTECSGFVGGVIARTTGRDRGYSNAASFSGDNFSGRSAGSALSHANGGISGRTGVAYSGHVVIYVGYLPEGAPDRYKIEGEDTSGPGEYVIECTTGANFSGTVFRRVDVSAKYNQCSNWWNR